MNRKAILIVLSKKAHDKEMVVLDRLEIADSKTKLVKNILKSLPLSRLNALIVLPQKNENISKAARNIKQVKLIEAPQLNVLDLLRYKYIILPEQSITVIEKTFLNKP